MLLFFVYSKKQFLKQSPHSIVCEMGKSWKCPDSMKEDICIKVKTDKTLPSCNLKLKWSKHSSPYSHDLSWRLEVWQYFRTSHRYISLRLNPTTRFNPIVGFTSNYWMQKHPLVGCSNLCKAIADSRVTGKWRPMLSQLCRLSTSISLKLPILTSFYLKSPPRFKDLFI